MVWCMTIHTCCWWKWTFPCIMSRLLTIVKYHWSSISSKTSSCSSSTFVACPIPSWCTILRHLIILHDIVLRLSCVVLWLYNIIWLLRNIILLLRSVVWRWNLTKMRCGLPSHHFYLHFICIWCPFSHHLHGSAIFVVVAHWLAKGEMGALWDCLVFLHCRIVIRVVAQFLADFAP
jgi:hypothetical protein